MEADVLAGNLNRYTVAAWPVLEPATEFVPGPHLDVIAEYLEAVSEGDIRRLIINMPPRYMKSISVSVMWPTWEWARRPERRFMFSSYAQSLADKHSTDRRTLIESQWYRARWPHVEFADDQNTKRKFQNTARGQMLATSFGGMATGEGGDVLVIDDPLDPEEAHSAIERTKVNRLFDQKFITRLDDKTKGAIVIVMQRLHEDDLVGHLLAKGGDEWTVLRLPGLAEKHEVITYPRSGRQFVRAPGDALWREPPELLAHLRDHEMGAFAFASQYQQRPSPAEGGILRRAWWQFYDPANLVSWTLPTPDYVVCSWDTSLKGKTTSDYCVGQAWAYIGAYRYLLRGFRERCGLPETKLAVHEMDAYIARTFPNIPRSTVVENAANGPEVVAELREFVNGITLSNPDGDKVRRAHAVTPQLQAGQVFLPGFRSADGNGADTARTAPWVLDFIEECAVFDHGTHDDQVDAFTQAMKAGMGAGVLPKRSSDPDRADAAMVTRGLADRRF